MDEQKEMMIKETIFGTYPYAIFIQDPPKDLLLVRLWIHQIKYPGSRYRYLLPVIKCTGMACADYILVLIPGAEIGVPQYQVLRRNTGKLEPQKMIEG